jgi:UDP-N-acetylmuramyl pentapeptide phosphotransferase/UDP-N-acetylglucosamine-1-phosphate transferase
MNIYFVVFTVTLLASVALVVTQCWHGKFSLDGIDGAQKFHTLPTPRIGGVAIALGFVTLVALSAPDVCVILCPLLLAGIPAFASGLAEDVTKKMGVLPRLLATALSGVLAWALTGVVIQNTGILPLDWLLGFKAMAVLFTAFSVGGLANAINIIDGFNGLAAGAVVIMLGAIGLIAQNVGDTTLATGCFGLVAVTLGFGAVNWPLGKIFLGDGGAYLLGFCVGWLAVLLPMRNPQVSTWVSLLICAYPVLEVGFSYLRKSKRAGHSPDLPDKVHLHMLAYRRLSRPFFSRSSQAKQNGMTSLYMWSYTMLPAGWALVFAGNTKMLVLGFAVAIFTYSVVYARLTQFRWYFGRRRNQP